MACIRVASLNPFTTLFHMKPHTISQPVLLFGMLLVAISCLVANSLLAELRIGCEVDGKFYALFSVRDGKIQVNDGTRTIDAPKNAKWKFDGDLKANATLALMLQDYTFERSNLADSERSLARAYQSLIKFNETREIGERDQLDSFAAKWPNGASRDSCMFLVWCVNGQPAQIRAVILPDTTGKAGTPEVEFR